MVPGNRIVQFPFIAFVRPFFPVFPAFAGPGSLWMGSGEQQVEEEIQCHLEKRQAATRRLQEQAAKQRTEKMGCQQEELVAIGELKALWSTLKKVDFDTRFDDAGFSSPEDLDDDLRKTEKSLIRARNKELGTEESEGKEAPSFSLIDVPDPALDEDDLREKRRQKLVKAGYDARIRWKAEKEEERRRVEERERRDRELRESDLGMGLDGLRRGHGSASRLRVVAVCCSTRSPLSSDGGTGGTVPRVPREGSTNPGLRCAGHHGQDGGAQRAPRATLGRQVACGAEPHEDITALAAHGKAGKKRKRGERDDGVGLRDADWAVYPAVEK